MEVAVMIVMGVSILGLAALFYIKHWEERHARIFMPSLRLSADERALQLKSLVQRGQAEFQKLGPTTLRFSRTILHDLALYLAALSRASERQAHRLADMVSHKHRFERRESKNEFLKQVAEIPIRNIREVAPAQAASAPVVQEVRSEPAAAVPIPESRLALEEFEGDAKPVAPISVPATAQPAAVKSPKPRKIIRRKKENKPLI